MNGAFRQVALERLEFRRVMDADIANPVAITANEGDQDQLPDFSLVDVNPNSATYNQAVSPRDYLGQVSAWYLGNAT